MDLAKCLSAAGDAIVPADKDLLLAQVKKYRKEGKEGNEAAVAAVEEMLGSYQAEHQTIVEQVAKAFNVKQREKPRPVQTPPAAAAPTPPVVEAETQIQDFPAPLTDADAVRPELNVLIQQIEEAMDTGNIPTEQIPEVEETPTQATAPGPLAPQLEGLEEKHLRDVGATPEVYNNPHNYKDPNTTTPILDRFITRVKAASQQLGAKAGIRFRDLQASDFDTSAGPVVLQVGGDSDVRPANYMRGVLEDLYELAAEFNPQGVYVLLPEDLAVRGNPLGVQGGHFTENGIHYIIPRHLTNITEQGSHWTRPGENQYSPYAKLDAWSTLQHEFGHSLIHDFFFSGLTREERALFELGLKQAQPVVDPELLAKLDPGAQALLQKWLTFRADVNNNRISGREAAARWLSPAKLQKKATFTKPGISWGGSDWSARNLRDALNTHDDRLSLDEFLAEQMPKYMYQRGLAGSKTLDAAYGGKFDAGKAEAFVEGNIAAFFRPLIDLLQKVFNTMQVKGMIGPEKEFTDWVEGLSRRGREAVKGEQGKGQAAAAPYQEERIDWSVPSRENKLKNALSSLVRSRVLNGNSKQYKELRRHLINEEWEEFLNGIEPLLGEKLKLDRVDPSLPKVIKVNGRKVPTQNSLGWALGRTEQEIRAFWEWFGASKTVDAQGRPNVYYHGSGADFESFMVPTDLQVGSYQAAIWFASSPDKASGYARWRGEEDGTRAVVYPVYLKIERPYTLTEPRALVIEDDVVRYKKAGIDGLVFKDSKEFDVQIWVPKDYLNVVSFEDQELDEEFNALAQEKGSYPTRTNEAAGTHFDFLAQAGDEWSGDLLWLLQKYSVPFRIKQIERSVTEEAIMFSPENIRFALNHQVSSPRKGISYDITDDLTPPEDKRTQLLVARVANRFAGMFKTGLEVKEWPGRRISNLSDFTTVMTSTDFAGAESLVVNVLHWRDAMRFRDYLQQFPEAAGDPFTVSNFSTLHMEYDEDTGNFSSYTDPALDNNLVELTPEGIYKLKGTTTTQIINLFGEALARVAVRLKNPDLYLQWIRTSGALRGKRGSGIFRLAGNEAAPLHAYMPERRLRDMSLAFTNPLDATWLSALFGQMQQQGINPPKITSVDVRLKNPLAVDLQGAAFTPQVAATVMQQLKNSPHDGARVFNSSTLQGAVYVSRWATKLPAAREPVPATFPASLHFDISDPEEAMYANKWQTLRSKLSLPILGEAISRLHRAKYVFMQTSQLAHLHPEWSWFTEFRQTVSKFYRRTAELHSRADAAIREINRTLGKEALAKLDKFTTDEFRGGEHWTDIKEEVDVQGRKHTVHVPGEKLLAKLREYGFDPDTLRGKKFASAYIAAKNALAYQMDEFEQMLINIRWQKYRAHQNPLVMQQKIAEVIRTFRVLRAQPFWPQMTFGRYLVRVTKREGNHSYVVHEFGTESIKEWELEEQKVRAKYKKEQGFEIHSEDQKASTNEGVILMRLPVEFLDDLAVAMGLDNSQLDPVLDADRIQENKDKLSQIRDLMQSLYEKSPTKTYDPMKRLIEGGSTDFVEKFASFALTTSNFIAKAEYRKLLDNTLQTAKAVSSALPAGKEKAEIEVGRGFLRDTLHYTMDPQEEMHKARAFVAVTYLAGNVATALMQFQGLMFTWAFLNRELGYLKGSAELATGLGSSARTLFFEFKDQASAMLAGSGDQAIRSVTDPTWGMVDGKPTELRRALEQAKEENLLDQNYSYYLAGFSSRGSLARMTKYAWGRGAKLAIDISMAAFRGGELVVRRTTFIAVYRTLEKTQPGLTPQQRYEKAAELTLLLQGDYTKGNRPKIMRGKLPSLMFVFYTFPLNAAWQIYGGLELGLRRQEKLSGRATPAFYRNHGAQLTLLMLAMAGLEGLPFAENLFDVIDMIWKRWIEPGKSARTALREALSEFTDHPQRFIHGVAYDVGGFDLSRRIGLGRIVPGTEHLAENFTPAYEKIGKVGTGLLGVPGGYLNWMVDTFERVSQASEFGGMDKGMEKLGQQMARLPGGTGNIVKAFEWARYDARDHLGGLIAWDEATGKGRPTYWWEEVGKGIGVNPTAVSERQAMRAAQNDAIDYWQERKKWVLSNYFTAHEVTKDREAMADSARDLADFQQKVPFPEMRIKDPRRSKETRRRMMESSTNLIPVHKSYQPLAREIEESF